MLSIDFIRENQKQVEDSSHAKGIEVDVAKLLKLDNRRRELLEKIDAKRHERNRHADSLKGSQGPPPEEEIEKGKALKEELAELEEEFSPLEEEYTDLLKQVPNVATEDTPVGASEDENQVVYEWGDKPEFDFEPKNHWEIAEKRGWIDKERAAKVTGARFAYIKGELAELQFALIQLVTGMLNDSKKIAEIANEFKVQGISDKPFTAVLPPLMIREDVFDAMDRLEPREDRYKIDGEDLWLQGSAEHVLGSIHMDEILEEDDLPIRYLGYATSFRREAGTYGKDMEGIIRMHQFDKLEMEILATPELGLKEHMLTIAIQEYLLRHLNIPYRKLLKCTADIGKPNARGVDMDAWLPGQNGYKETHTADFMTDYQTRRLKTRVRKRNGEIVYAYTIDATAFALGRTMVAIMENFQTADGQVVLPEALRPYMNNREKI